MMRHVIISLMLVLTLCMAGAALAASKEKSLVLHCGCTDDGLAMQYTQISISSKSKGHDAHVVGTVDSCFDGVDTYTDFVRTGDDCQISGPALGEPIGLCSGFQTPPVAGEACGEVVVTP